MLATVQRPRDRCRVRSCERLPCPGCSLRASWMLPGTAASMPVSPRVLGIQHVCQRHQQLMRPSDLCRAPPCRAAVCLLHACRWAEGSLPACLNHVAPSTFSVAFKLVHVRPCSSTCEACTVTCRTSELTVSLHASPLPILAVRGLLLDSRRKAQPSNYAPAVAEGLLAVRSDRDDAAGRHSAGLAAAAGQQAEVAMLCLERLISLGGCWKHTRLTFSRNFSASLGCRSAVRTTCLLSSPEARCMRHPTPSGTRMPATLAPSKAAAQRATFHSWEKPACCCSPTPPHPLSTSKLTQFQPSPHARRRHSFAQQQGPARGPAGADRLPAGEAVQA